MATQTATAIFRSPKKPDRSREVEFPPTHARLYHEGVKDGDTSWDVPITTTDGANLIVERPRAEDRPEARKVVYVDSYCTVRPPAYDHF
jgi:nitrogen fixation protein FixH